MEGEDPVRAWDPGRRREIQANGPDERVRVRGADLKREYYAEYRKVEDVHWWFVGRRRILLQVLDQYIGHNGSGPRRILDVGCGTGTMLTYLASFGKAEGVDIDAEAIGYCLERGLQDVRLGEASALPFADSTFDLVTALDVVEHLDDDGAAFREAWRVLRPGGHLLVTVPAHRFLWGDQDEVNMHKRRYVSRELRERLVEARFEVVRLSYMNALLLPPIAAARLLRRLEHRLRPRIQAESDFRYPAPGPLNHALGWVFGAEAAVLKRADIPFGVSILALARKAGGAI